MSTTLFELYVVRSLTQQNLAEAQSEHEALLKARQIAREQQIEVNIYRRHGQLWMNIRPKEDRLIENQYLCERIVVSKDICHGKPRIAGTRIMVYLILDLLADGKTIEEITTKIYPDLKPEDIFACISYASKLVQKKK